MFPMQTLPCCVTQRGSTRMYIIFTDGMRIHTHSCRKQTHSLIQIKTKIILLCSQHIEQVQSGKTAGSACVSDYWWLTGVISWGPLSLFTHIDLLVTIVQMNVWGGKLKAIEFDATWLSDSCRRLNRCSAPSTHKPPVQ